MFENLQFLEANKYLIRYYYIYKYKSFLRAAENFYISSTDRNMKYTVTQLESFYGVQLVKVSGNKLDFTEFGHTLGIEAEKIYNINFEINSILQRSDLKEIRFATTYDFYNYYIKQIFTVFQQEQSDAKIILLKTNQFDSIKRLIKHEIDFIVGTSMLNNNPDLTFQKMTTAKILLAVKKENKNKFQNIKALEELKLFKGAMNDFTDPFYYNFEKTCRDNNIDLNINFYSSDFNSLIDIVKNGYADYSLVGNYTGIDDLFFLDVSSFFEPVDICFIYRKGETPSRAIEKLIEISQKLNIEPI